MTMEEATLQLQIKFSTKKTTISGTNTDIEDDLQNFVEWFMVNLKMFPELYEADSGISSGRFSIELM